MPVVENFPRRCIPNKTIVWRVYSSHLFSRDSLHSMKTPSLENTLFIAARVQQVIFSLKTKVGKPLQIGFVDSSTIALKSNSDANTDEGLDLTTQASNVTQNGVHVGLKHVRYAQFSKQHCQNGVIVSSRGSSKQDLTTAHCAGFKLNVTVGGLITFQVGWNIKRCFQIFNNLAFRVCAHFVHDSIVSGATSWRVSDW